MRIIIANWKLNPQTLAEAKQIASKIDRGLWRDSKRVEAVICPPAIFLSAVKPLLRSSKLGAQNSSDREKGAFTGEISVLQLKSAGADYAIIGHSERRARGEDDASINEKIKLAIKRGIRPILCVGFGTKKGSASAIKAIIKKQVQLGLRGVRGGVIIAYEPVWAISRGFGTGSPATPQHAVEIINFIRKLAPKARVIYGGSVDGKNAAGFAAEYIDGALVGGASLVPSEFLKIIKAFSV